ncbi:hypothetical protein [Nocardioides sp. TF02-7]|uniref:hypothetical protein n=1 Tax=Nocardioides sp. TF02-7 TaxID=2917724 RepID=UPI0031F484C0
MLYVGTSKDLRRRVRSYFTASETRSRIGEMVRLAASVTGIECATPLEAEVRELRLIAEHKPSYNRRSKFPEKMTFVKLTREPWPRLSLVKRVLDDDADYLGPFSSRATAESCLAALHETFPIRQCSDRFGRQPARSACVLAELGRCLSPCDGSVDLLTYGAVVRQLRDALLRHPDDVVELVNAKMAGLAEQERFEEAGAQRDRLAAFVRGAARTQRLTSLTRCPGGGGRAPRGRRAVVGPRGPSRPAGRRRRDPQRDGGDGLYRPAARVRGDGGALRRSAAGGDGGGVRANPALARAARGPARRHRRRVDLPGARRRSPRAAARWRLTGRAPGPGS